MANTNLTTDQVRSTIKALDKSPSCYDTSSPVYGQRKTASSAHRSRSSEGNMKESGFRMPGKARHSK